METIVFQREETNGNEQTSRDDLSTPDGEIVEPQTVPRRDNNTGSNQHNNKKRRKWDIKENKTLMECYYKSKPQERGYMKRMHTEWSNLGMPEVSAQRLADQVRCIKKKKWLSDVQLEEIERRVKSVENQVNIDDGVQVNVEEQEDQQTINNNTPEIDEINRDNIVSDPEDDPELEQWEVDLRSRITSQMQNKNKNKIPNLRYLDQRTLSAEVDRVNKVIESIPTTNLEETNNLIHSAALVVCENLGATHKPPNKKRKIPPWKFRLTKKIEDMRRDLSRLETVRSRTEKPSGRLNYLNQKYKLHKTSVNEVIENLRQEIKAISAKIKRYEDRVKQFQQNRMFRTNQRRVYQDLNGENEGDGGKEMPDKAETVRFWSDLWGTPVHHTQDAEWLNEIRDEVTDKVEQQPDVTITTAVIKKQLKKLTKWKAPGPDGIQGYWYKYFDSLHERLATQMQHIINTGDVETWMTKGRTVLIMKDKAKGTNVKNYRPITCLAILWKILTGVLSDKIYNHLDKTGWLLPEQKGCRRRSRGTKDQILIDKMIINNCRRHNKNLAVSWLDYRKAYDSVPHSWIVETLNIFGVANNITAFIKNSMTTWRTDLTIHGEILGSVSIKRGIFQGDSLSPLLFIIAMLPLTLCLRKQKVGYQVKKATSKINHLLYMDDLKLYSKNYKELDSLVNTVRIVSTDIHMQFGVDKCAVLTMHRGKIDQCRGIELPNEETIKQINIQEGYKYLGILQADDIKHDATKVKLKKEYIRRVKKVLSSKLNSRNMVTAINTWAVPVLRYPAGVIHWTKEELKVIDRKTRKLLTVNKTLHPRSSVARLYLPRKIGGRGLISIEECVESEERCLEEYVNSSKEEYLMIVSEESKRSENKDSSKEYKARKLEEKISLWKEKSLHGQYPKQIEGVDQKETWRWLQFGDLKKETEGMLMAAQDQALPVNAVKANIHHQIQSPLCRLCKTESESVSHIVSGCAKLAQVEYKKRHDKVATTVHWHLCKKYELPHSAKWYDHEAEKVLENDNAKLLWDYTIRIDHYIKHRRPDIILLDKKENVTYLIDIAVPMDANVSKKEEEKVTKYSDLAREVSRLWKTKTRTVPIVIGALGAITKNVTSNLKKLGISLKPGILQKSALLGTSHILRKVLEQN